MPTWTYIDAFLKAPLLLCSILYSDWQIYGLHTFIRSIETPRDEFIFYSKRLIRLLIEFALSLLPFKVRIVHSALNYTGKWTLVCDVDDIF